MSLNVMDVLPFRPVVPARFRPSAVPRESEDVLAEISALVAKRQELRASGGSSARLERNRIAIARAQWELSHSLIRRHRPGLAADAA